MNVSTELLQLLSEVGYLACFRGDTTRSQVIMDGINAVGLEHIPIKMGVAITKIYAGDYETAVEIIRDQVLVQDPNHMSAKCFLGIAYTQQGKVGDAQQLFEDVIARGNEDERNIASAYLNS